MISSLLHLVGLRPQVYYTVTNFRGGGARPHCPALNTPMGLFNIEQLFLINGHFELLKLEKIPVLRKYRFFSSQFF